MRNGHEAASVQLYRSELEMWTRCTGKLFNGLPLVARVGRRVGEVLSSSKQEDGRRAGGSARPTGRRSKLVPERVGREVFLVGV